jgi:hypothetical protein
MYFKWRNVRKNGSRFKHHESNFAKRVLRYSKIFAVRSAEEYRKRCKIREIRHT